MKSNKGFTLIELLAVIVILAIIALIATPVILGVVETAREGAAKSAVLGYVDAVEKQVMINQLDDTKTDIQDDDYTVTAGTGAITGTKTGNTTAIDIDVKGEAPSSTKMTILGGEVQQTNFVMTVNGKEYNFTYANGSASKTTASAGAGE